MMRQAAREREREREREVMVEGRLEEDSCVTW
jgi:hypothetical protein